MAVLPYVTTPGNIEKALQGIKAASTPSSVSQDFVKTVIGITGSSGNMITSYLKKIGFAAKDGTPTEIYTRFRNSQMSGCAVADAIRHGYTALYTRNEFMHELSDADLRGLIIEETGAASDSKVPTYVLSAITALKKLADFDADPADNPTNGQVVDIAPIGTAGNNVPLKTSGVGLNLSYTINLNLPATSDIAVFNAIFKSLKENLLREDDE